MTMNVETIQSGKGQDFGICGIGFDSGTGVRFEYGVVADGHGDDRYINGVRSTTATEFSSLIASSSPMDSIIAHLNSKCVLSYNSGCTFVLVKIYNTHDTRKVEVYSIGDSRCAIYVDGVQVYITTPHNLQNPSELARLSSRDRIKRERCKDPIPEIAGARKVVGRRSEYIVFEDLTRLAVSQSLGHNGITGINMEKYVHEYHAHQKVKVVAGSDGFWDMHYISQEPDEDSVSDHSDIIRMSASELAKKSVERWKQDWDYYWNSAKPEVMFTTQFHPDNYDDVTVFTWISEPSSPKKSTPEEEYVRALLNGSLDA
jgi:serine/threonine protein phosphatase PrpC